MKKIYQKQYAGLTLIEVLIALAIIAIAMTAVIKATTQTIRATNYLQTKMIATWLGADVMNEARSGLRKLPDPPDQYKEKLNILNQDWYVTAKLEETPNKRIKQIVVHVYKRDPENDEAQSIIDLVSYYYVATQKI